MTAGEPLSDEPAGHTVTLREVAAAAGVSTSTVSRVLDERLPVSRTATAARIRAVAADLGYRRNQAASSLRRARSGTLGVLVPRLTDTVMSMMFEAIYREASRRGHFAIVSICGDDPHEEALGVDALLARQVDGLLLATSRVDDDLPRQLRERGVPHVLVLRTDGTSPSAVGDDELGGYLATRHLLDLGHQDIALLAGPDFASTARDRRRGYERALREAGLEVSDERVVATTFSVEAGEEAGRGLLTGVTRPTAVFAVNDNLAVGVSAVANRMGLTIGHDVSIVGYNDIPIVSRLTVPLTSVRTPFDRIAAEALDSLFEQRAPDARSQHGSRDLLRRTAPTLIPRRSSGAAPH